MRDKSMKDRYLKILDDPDYEIESEMFFKEIELEYQERMEEEFDLNFDN